jgi:hypothetical protein
MTGSKKKSSVSFANGFITCQEAGTEDTEDGEVRCAGGHMRFKASRVEAYIQAEPGVVELYLEDRRGNFEVYCTVSEMDEAIKRSRVHEAKTTATGKD